MASEIEPYKDRPRQYFMRHTAAARARIRAVALVDRLQLFALGERDPQHNAKVEMSNAQVRAALGVLGKILPDLKESDVHHHPATPETPQAMIQRLTALVGEQNVGELLKRMGFKHDAQTAQDAVLAAPGDEDGQSQANGS